MDYNNFREKIYYMNLKDMIPYLLSTATIAILFIIFSFFNRDFIYDLQAIWEFIIVIILLTLSIHLRGITKRETYGVIQVFLFINFTLDMIFLSPEGYFNAVKIIFSYNMYHNYIFSNLIILFYMIAKYRKYVNIDKKIYLEYLFWLV
ncbi:hypothetical protein R0131_15960, partial [Clostridium sp. AL.422]|uniref:hypothetical protein n=1 Tax=Clostridium TaxID=1485 RepID=UPI00293DBE9D